VPSKHLKDFLNYLEEYSRPPSCTTTFQRFFSCKKYRSVNSDLRSAFEDLPHIERQVFYAKILQICSSVINKKSALPTSLTQLDLAPPPETT
jgi:hypothetical protein